MSPGLQYKQSFMLGIAEAVMCTYTRYFYLLEEKMCHHNQNSEAFIGQDIPTESPLFLLRNILHVLRDNSK